MGLQISFFFFATFNQTLHNITVNGQKVVGTPPINGGSFEV